MQNQYNNNNNPYQNNQNPFDDDGLNKQRQILEEQQKLKYKSDSESGLDNIIKEYTSAIHNQLSNWTINISDKASITRYYKRYWDNQAFMLSIFIMLITFVSSFYTKYSSIGIIIVFFIQYFYSQKYFFRYFTNDHKLVKEDFDYIYNEIFGYKFNYIYIFIISFILTIISFNVSFNSINFLIDFTQYPQLVKILHINIQNELYAFTNVFSIFILIIIKIVEKWK
jgi:hypothetical protein